MNFWPLLAAGIWPMAVLAGTVALVTIIALLRAPRDHASAVFASFAGAFGIHRDQGYARTDPTQGSVPSDGSSSETQGSETADNNQIEPLEEGA
ncbi:MAG: hypothetical protein JWN03_2246 [Nocardia sp.]|uniref:hypothetical protein n=1 Tax=Nocardia sp. TaxID=1821 RepID=UPI0026307632|nr:hypothetical protein [Nocardia sp.]MCU1641971.1 hypothetical protein [Nocardia sp.]